MERIVEETDGKISYKKVGGGSLRWNKRLIKPGQIIRLNPDEVPHTFRDVLIPLEQIREKVVAPIVYTKSEYKLTPHGKSKSLYDVVDSQGKVLNDKSLTKAVAEEFITELNK
jgi:hypothetical protein